MRYENHFRWSSLIEVPWILTLLLAVLGMGTTLPGPSRATASEPEIAGDIDRDCNVDRNDVLLLLADRNRPVGASACGSACDLDHDGVITVLDARKLILLCTRPRCAVVAPSCGSQEPVDCEVSAWSGWSACSAECGGGTQTRTRTVITPPENGGEACGALEETRPCNEQPCPAFWQMKQRDMQNTGRADYTVPEARQNDTFFNTFLWQTRSPGGLSSTSMVFFDGVGPGGKDIAVGGYHWPKGVQGMDRHTGAVFWSGNPGGGETIGRITPAFSNDGTVVYVTNDATANHPLMAFAAAVGPSAFWHNGADPNPDRLRFFSPTIAPDGRIFLHRWNDRPYAGTDDGAKILETWAADTSVHAVYSDPALYLDGDALMVVSSGRSGTIKAYDGTTGAGMWSVDARGTDASVTIDPASGNIYVGTGLGGAIHVVGLDKAGNPLWSEVSRPVFDPADGDNGPQRAQAAGALSHDGSTYYFQTNSREGDGRLYAIDTGSGDVKWAYETGSLGWEMHASSPIVTEDNVIVVGNNDNGTYFAIRDDGARGTLLDTFSVDPDGTARASATISPDGKLYLPLRTRWTVGEGATNEAADLFTAFDVLHETALVTVPDLSGMGQEEAVEAILAANLRVGEVASQGGGGVPEGAVVGQEPAAGASVAEGSEVDVWISSGTALVYVPDVTGMSRWVAEAMVIAAGLTVGTVNTLDSETVPPGDVISQDPPVGAEIEEGGCVDLQVATLMLESLRVLPGSIVFHAPGETEQLTVTGIFQDGSERDLSAAGSGTLYRPWHTSALRVEPDGLVTAESSGFGQVLITNSGIGAVVDVRVMLPPVAPSQGAVDAVSAMQQDGGRPVMARWNPRNGTIRSLFLPGGYLTEASDEDALAIARDFLLANPDLFQIDEAALDEFRVDSRYSTAHNGVTHIVLRQTHEGIPFRYNLIQINVADHGRVLSFGGDYDPSPVYPDMAPSLDASDALVTAAARLAPEEPFVPVIRSGPEGAARRTVFEKTGPDDFDPHTAGLVLAARPDGIHLAWWVMLNRKGQYSVLVDAHSAEVFQWHDVVSYQSAAGIEALVVADNPDKTAQEVRPLPDSWFSKEDPEKPYLSIGPYVDTYMHMADGTDTRPYRPKHYLAELGDWSHTDSGIRPSYAPAMENAFYWMNRLHDIFYDSGFDDSTRNFVGERAVSVEVNATKVPDERSPCRTVNNSCFYWRGGSAENMRPEIAMGLEWGEMENKVLKYAGVPVWSANHALSAEILAHEYTHGVSGTLVMGPGELLPWLGGIQSSAGSEALSDFFGAAITDEPVVLDYVTPRPEGMRPCRLDDCSFDYGDLDALSLFNAEELLPGVRSQHDISVVLSSALWGVREKLIDAYGPAGRDWMEILVVDAMKMTDVMSPDFLDMRNAVLKADLSPEPGANREIIWEVFADKGMGYDAKCSGSGDLHPTADYKLPPPEIESLSLGDSLQAGVAYDFRISGIFFSETSVVSIENLDTGSRDPDVTFSINDANEIDVSGYTFAQGGEYEICVMTEYGNQALPVYNGWHGDCRTVHVSEEAPHIYTVVGIDRMSGDTGINLMGINNEGQAVGYVEYVDSYHNSYTEAVIWDIEGGSRHALPRLGSFLNSKAYKINDSGQVVGNMSYADSLGRSHSQAVIWEPDGSITPIGTLDGATVANLNNAGQVVGGSRVGGSRYHAFIWTNGVMSDLGTLEDRSSSNSLAADINSNGVVVGNATFPMVDEHWNTITVARAVMWAGGGIVNLGCSGGELGSSVAVSINDSNQIAGNDMGIGRLWNGSPGGISLGTLGGVGSMVFSINNAGQIVGSSGMHAFLWEEGTMYDLNDCLVDGSDWELVRALDINDQGWIIGFGDYRGSSRSFVMIPVERTGGQTLIID